MGKELFGDQSERMGEKLSWMLVEDGDDKVKSKLHIRF